jgi:uncharacterized protein YndB with AHSA1/START domain
MNKATFTLSDDKKTLTMERRFDAPADRLWDAYADPNLLAQWFSPRGWTTEVRAHRFEEGGEFSYIMRCVDESQDWFGQTSSGMMRFSSITPKTRFEYTDVFTDGQGVVNESLPASHSVVHIVAQSPTTSLLRVETSYATPEAMAQVLEMGMESGYAETLDKLDEVITA